MQGFIILAIIGIEKHTLIFYSTLNSDKSQWSMKCRSRVHGQGTSCRVCQLQLLRKAS